MQAPHGARSPKHLTPNTIIFTRLPLPSTSTRSALDLQFRIESETTDGCGAAQRTCNARQAQRGRRASSSGAAFRQGRREKYRNSCAASAANSSQEALPESSRQFLVFARRDGYSRDAAAGRRYPVLMQLSLLPRSLTHSLELSLRD
ncbi:hypothetical protein PHYPSEUDO_006554 [Phytophthora pseudosyringae]|uniref:Uncharacterized protein n=1 Tax=Phytophthora pseudosyringae TaxID=221518 RepID=A0A8T1VIT4_9STRA|nr:hypothetical protein PHYPSEUDO_006554 [Phytophthora pseudosyringae]